jgi:dihydroxyacetone kinase-like predicted kinase
MKLFYGADMPRKEVFRIEDRIRAVFPEQEIEIQEGCQPHYQLIIAIE